MRPTGFGITPRETGSRYTVMPAAVWGKRGREARNPGIQPLRIPKPKKHAGNSRVKTPCLKDCFQEPPAAR